MSLPRSRSHTDLPTLGTNPKQSQSESKTEGAKDLTALCSTRQTVCKHRVDFPRGLGGLSVGCGRPPKNNSQTTSTAPLITDLPPNTRGPSAPRGLSGHPGRTVRQTLPDQKHPTKRIETRTRKNMRRTRRRHGKPAPHGPSATPWRTVRHEWTEQPDHELASTQPHSLPWISQTA
jgi:hypothetical protein